MRFKAYWTELFLVKQNSRNYTAMLGTEQFLWDSYHKGREWAWLTFKHVKVITMVTPTMGCILQEWVDKYCLYFYWLAEIQNKDFDNFCNNHVNWIYVWSSNYRRGYTKEYIAVFKGVLCTTVLYSATNTVNSACDWT